MAADDDARDAISQSSGGHNRHVADGAARGASVPLSQSARALSVQARGSSRRAKMRGIFFRRATRSRDVDGDAIS
jgi:hypothetical protein